MNHVYAPLPRENVRFDQSGRYRMLQDMPSRRRRLAYAIGRSVVMLLALAGAGYITLTAAVIAGQMMGG